MARVTDALGLYRPARWLQVHLFRRDLLAYHERNETFYRALVPRGSLVFDVGAHRGDMTRAFVNLGARVVAFEPQAPLRRTIRARLGARDDLTVLECALGPEPGEARFFVNEKHPGSSSLVEDWPGEVTKVEVVPISTLDLMIEKHGRPAYIKIDVEGFEVDVLSGLSHHVPLISFEQTRDRENGLEQVQKCIELIAALGKNLEVNVTPAETLEFSLPQWISADEFLEKYPADFSDFAFRYGDVFVRSDPR